MHPVAHRRLSGQRLCLRNLIFMMDRNVIHSAGMNVKAIA